MEQQEQLATPELAVGDTVTGVVEQVMPYGAFVRCSGGQKAMVHISQLSHRYIKQVEDVLTAGQEIRAQVIKIDERGRVDLSMKALEEPPAPMPPRRAFAPRPQGSASPLEGDDFERKLSQFLKTSEDKISTLNAKNKGPKSGRRKGGRA